MHGRVACGITPQCVSTVIALCCRVASPGLPVGFVSTTVWCCARGTMEIHGSCFPAAGYVWVFRVPGEPGGRLPLGGGGPGRAAGDADRRGQESLLPASGDCAGWDGAGGESADCFDGRPGGQTDGEGAEGRTDSFRALARGGSGGLPGLSRWDAAVFVHCSGAIAGSGVSGDAGAAQAFADCYRRTTGRWGIICRCCGRRRLSR